MSHVIFAVIDALALMVCCVPSRERCERVRIVRRFYLNETDRSRVASVATKHIERTYIPVNIVLNTKEVIRIVQLRDMPPQAIVEIQQVPSRSW